MSLLLAVAGRPDWGLGNPNKAGALMAGLIPLLWILPSLPVWRTRPRAGAAAFALALLGSFGLGVALLLTESRGGLLAAVVAMAILLVGARRPWPTGRTLAVALTLPAILLVGTHAGAWRRLAPEYALGDASIHNRVPLWRAAPAMMADAPAGWGAGNAGAAYGRWYQPPGNTQAYRVLVSSHLTWLVEHGRLARMAYVSVWLGVLVAAYALARRGDTVVPAAMLTGQLIAWQVSDVAESPWVAAPVWITGVVTLGVAMRTFGRRRVATGTALSLLAGVTLVLSTEILYTGRSGVHRNAASTRVVGQRPGRIHLLASEGPGAPSPREWRDRFGAPGDRPTLVWWDKAPTEMPKEATEVVVFGATGPLPWLLPAGVRLTLVSPAAPPEVLLPSPGKADIRILFGEFGRKPGLAEWRRLGTVILVEGEGDYLPAWPDLIGGDAK